MYEPFVNAYIGLGDFLNLCIQQIRGCLQIFIDPRDKSCRSCRIVRVVRDPCLIESGRHLRQCTDMKLILNDYHILILVVKDVVMQYIVIASLLAVSPGHSISSHSIAPFLFISSHFLLRRLFYSETSTSSSRSEWRGD